MTVVLGGRVRASVEELPCYTETSCDIERHARYEGPLGFFRHPESLLFIVWAGFVLSYVLYTRLCRLGTRCLGGINFRESHRWATC